MNNLYKVMPESLNEIKVQTLPFGLVWFGLLVFFCIQVLGIITMFSGKCETVALFFSVSSGLLVGTLPWMPFFFLLVN